MEMKHLEYFIEVTDTGSFTQAAENLYITQPALSRIIKSLESELGAPLFIRSRKKLLLTDVGRILYKHAQVIERQLSLLEADIDNLLILKKGRIRLGLPTIVNSFFFSQLMASFHQQYPDVTFQLEEDGSKRIAEKIMNDDLDFGVVVLPENHEMFNYYKFVHDHLKLVVPFSHRLAAKEEIALHELKDESFIMFNRDFELRNLILEACIEEGFEPNIVSETSQLDFIEEMAAYNLGITLLPESTCMELTSDLQTITIANPKIEWNLALIWKKDAYLSQVAKEFIRFAKLKLVKENNHADTDEDE
ncbi:DNA-binding transcriptional regulator, LysR family [Alteribacillus persepolensis]|uniref:DNA-binding transcriptional regulator, LysR family n=1 Tax=Alteribacillus persepolensis TaxID=568899 RepID=A0A1G8HQJ3_9BACI|nr:LysR family transcriptional regulator [Alteribacillus persepolensis]SDI08956.1 DNA-binding transcriptional regulator, LysR family [Alteribacillus persepolensis]